MPVACPPAPRVPAEFFQRDGGLAQSVECVVRNDEAPGSKPGFSIVFAMRTGSESGNRRGDCASYQCLHSLVVRTPLCGSGNPGSNPGAGIYLCTVGLVGYDACFTRRRSRVRTSDCVLTSIGRVAQMVEHGSNKPRVVGSSPTVTTFCDPISQCADWIGTRLPGMQ